MNHEFLKKTYSRSDFINFNQSFLSGFTFEESSIQLSNGSQFVSAQTIGHALDGELAILEIKSEPTNLNKRIAITKEAFSIMRNHAMSNALIAFDDGHGKWRLSLLVTTLKLNSAGKVINETSNPRRYSYLLGAGAKIVTPYKYLIEKGRVEDLKQLQERFSVEVVNREFYNNIAALYDALVGSKDAILNDISLGIINTLTTTAIIKKDKDGKHYEITPLLKYPGSLQDSHEFAVRLIGRIIFCWFLREKKSSNGKPLIPLDLLSNLRATTTQDYYHNVLAVLFFEVLNKKIEKRRHEKFKSGQYQQIPYLNGGLFDANQKDYYKFDTELGLPVPGLIDVPDKWLVSFLELLERYSFTVDENTSYDTDISIDPEMLGRVFENLLARINPETGKSVRKSTGSFYTPREVVDYMVDAALTEYLVNHTKIGREKIEALISYDLDDDVDYKLNDDESVKVLEALSSVKVLDPAVGSGAYPMGILQKIVYVLSILDPDTSWWLTRQLVDATSEYKDELTNRSYDYIRKLGVIRNSIFGVDIQSTATEIARLRCFLTLIIDEDIYDNLPNRGIKPLPNLEFKFVTANTLIKLPEQRISTGQIQQNFFDNSQQEKIDKMFELIKEYFSANSDEKIQIIADYRLVMNELWSDMHRSNAYGDKSLALTGWEPFSNAQSDWFDSEWMFGVQNFDIVIGNPPYIQLQKNGGELADYYENKGYTTFQRTGDIYSLFYERGLELTKSGEGLLCYITSNKWMRSGYGASLRGLFSKKHPIKLIDLGAEVFETATVDTSILLISNSAQNNPLWALDLSRVKNISNIQDYHGDAVELHDLSEDVWFIASAQETGIKKKIEQGTIPLKNPEWKIKINRGILTGLNEAFTIDEATKDNLINQDPKSIEIIKPMLRGRDASRYKLNWDYLYLLTTHNGFGTHPAINADDYPAVKRHLDKYEPELSARGDQGITKYNLRNCAYMSEFSKEKIVYQELTQGSSFALDKEGVYYINASGYLITGPNLGYLTAVLNSKLINYAYKKFYCTLIGSKGVRWQYQHIVNIPIPYPDNDKIKLLADKLSQLTDRITQLIEKEENYSAVDNEIDGLVYELYGLDPDEIKIIEDSYAK